jgi:eukaryotic-like serine/threonine-protein kinase
LERGNEARPDDDGNDKTRGLAVPEEPGDNPEADPARSAGGTRTSWVIAGRYRVMDRLGSGAMADVFRAHDVTLDRDVAVKVFRTIVDDVDTAGNSRRELELQALAQLSHPNLITLFDGSVSDSAGDGPAFLALELVEGPTLAAMLADGAIPEPQVRRIGGQIADALAYIHERRMVHRDVKPANILLGSDDHGDPAAVRARLSDFGIVRLVDNAQVTSADLTVGTAYYLAPEQARTAAVGPEADVYALGLVLVEALTGKRAFEGSMHEVLIARLSRDPHIPAELPGPWAALLTAMTAADPAHRPSAAEVAGTLRSSADSGVMPIAGAAGLPAGLADHAGPAAAAAAARTAALRRNGYPLTVQPSASFPAPDDRSERSEPAAAGSRPTGLIIAAAVFLAIIAGTGWFLFRPSADPAPQQGQLDTTAGTTSAPSNGQRSNPSGTPHKHAVAPGPTEPVNRTFSRTRAAPSSAHRSSHPATSTPASTSSVPPTTAPPTRPSTTTNPPSSTSAAPSTTIAPSSSNAVPSTSSPATGESATSSADSSSAVLNTDLAAAAQ